jgi:hypothetical protein
MCFTTTMYVILTISMIILFGFATVQTVLYFLCYRYRYIFLKLLALTKSLKIPKW